MKAILKTRGRPNASGRTKLSAIIQCESIDVVVRREAIMWIQRWKVTPEGERKEAEVCKESLSPVA